MSLCQICGERLFTSSLSSDPLEHFCIGLDGPSIIDSHSILPHCLDSDSEDSRIVVKKTTLIPAPPKTAALYVHNPEDLGEIARLHVEVEELRRMAERRGEVARPTVKV